MTTIGFIGSGQIGGTVAKLTAAAGLPVVLSNSRGPETLADLVSEIGPLARAGTGTQAAEDGDIVVVSIPLKEYTTVPVEPLAGTTVIDTNNYYPQRDGHIAELDAATATSSELLQRHLPTSHVVKVFNNIFYKHLGALARPSGAPDRSALAIAGDNAGAKAAVTAFLDTIGYDAVDVGTLADSWRFEPGTPAYGGQYGSFENAAGNPASADAVRALLDQATHR